MTVSHSQGEQVVVEVHDSGPGLSDEARRTLFEPTITFKKRGMAGQGGRFPLSLPAHPNQLPGWKLCQADRFRGTNPLTMSGSHRRSINASERLAKPERQNNGGYPIRVLDREDMPCARWRTCNL